MLDKFYDEWSMNVIPPMGKMVTGDAEPYHYLVESIRKFPKPAELCRDDFCCRLFPGELDKLFRGHCRAPFRLEACEANRMSTIGPTCSPWQGPAMSWPEKALFLRCPPIRCRRLSGFAQKLAGSGSPPRQKPQTPRDPRNFRLRSTARPKLGEARPVSGNASRCGRAQTLPLTSNCFRTGWSRFPETRQSGRSRNRLADRLVTCSPSFSEPVAAASVAQVHKAVRKRDGVEVAVKVIRPACAPALYRVISIPFIQSPPCRKNTFRRHVGSARSLLRTCLPSRRKIEMDLRLEAAGLFGTG